MDAEFTHRTADYAWTFDEKVSPVVREIRIGHNELGNDPSASSKFKVLTCDGRWFSIDATPGQAPAVKTGREYNA